jgi:hypothetical protein
MSQQMQTEMTLPSVPRFDSPLHLWIAIWQRRIVYGEGVTLTAATRSSAR